MKYYYISSRSGQSGICKYSNDFYELILKQKGYEFIDSGMSLSQVLSQIAPEDQVHIEIGIFQQKEICLLMAMINADYSNLAITLHDAPLFKYPFRSFENKLFNNLSKFYDRYIRRFDSARAYIKKIKTVYVLTQKAVNLVKSAYQIEQVYFLHHVIDTREIILNEFNNNNFVYFGFIGRNKGLEYALQLHQQLLKKSPEIKFYIIGVALGKEKRFQEFLALKYRTNVYFLGYVPGRQLDEIFMKASFSILPFRSYKFFTPFSGSILYNLVKGRIVFTNQVNAIDEMVKEGRTGFYLSGNLEKDARLISEISCSKHILESMRSEIYQYLFLHHAPAVVEKDLVD